MTTQLSTTKLPPRLLSRRQLHLTGAQDLEFALARWQAALSALQRPLVRTDGDEKSWLVDYLQSVSTEATRLDSTEAQSPLLHQRIEQLRDRTAALKLADSAGQSRDVDSFVNVLPGGRRDRGLRVADAFWQLSTKSGSSDSVDSTIAAGGWAFDRRALDALLGFLVAILVGWIAWKSGPLWQWLQQREALAWIVLGLFWWLALKPGLFGLFMIAWGALGAVRHAKRPERPATEFEERSASKA